MDKRRQPHWYKIYIHTCPVCGHEEVYRERQYTPKPDKPEDRYSHSDIYDNCMDYVYGG